MKTGLNLIHGLITEVV